MEPEDWTVEDLVRTRHTEGSRPGERSDPCRLALLIEGGSSRSAYSSGMVVAIEDLGLTTVFDAVYGVSGGALNGAWLLCGRAAQVMDTWWNREVMRGVIAPRRALRGRPVVDTDYLVNTVYVDLVPMDFAAILGNSITFHPIATDAENGLAVDLAPLIHDESTLRLALRSSTGIPLLAGPPVHLAGRRFMDGGLAEMVPVRTALAQGATHAVVLRTRRPGEDLRPPGNMQFHIIRRYLKRHAAGAIPAWRNRYAVAQDEEKLLATHPRVRQIRPPSHGPTVPGTSRGARRLKATVDLGRATARSTLTRWLANSDPVGSTHSRG